MVKIGYLTPTDVINLGFGSPGDYIAKEVAHEAAMNFYIIMGPPGFIINSGGDALIISCGGAPVTGAVTDSGGSALVTRTNHGIPADQKLQIINGVNYSGVVYAKPLTGNTFNISLTPGGPNIPYVANETISWVRRFPHGLVSDNKVRIVQSSAGPYDGSYYAEVVDVDTFKIRIAIGGPLLAFSVQAQLFWFLKFGSADARNFSLGQASEGYGLRQNYLNNGNNVAELAMSYAYNNHNADGTLKAVHGDAGTNYTGPIGNRFWFYCPDRNGIVSDSGGEAVIYSPCHGLAENEYVMLKDNVYYASLGAGYYAVSIVDNDNFKIRENMTSLPAAFVAGSSGSTLKFSKVFGSSAMRHTDIAGTESNYVIACNAPGSQCIFRKSWEQTTSFGFAIFGGARYFRITGIYDPVLGIGDINYQGRVTNKAFWQGKHGMVFQFYNLITNNPVVAIGEAANYIEIDHVEIDGGNKGFAGLMLKTDGYPRLGTMYAKVHDNCIYFVDGEGCYISNTQESIIGGPQIQHANQTHFYNNLLIGTGVEILQFNNVAEGNLIEDNIAFLASLTRYAPFFTGQTTGFQYGNRIGGLLARNTIVQGFATNGVQIITQRSAEIPDPNKGIVFDNCVFMDGCARFSYYRLSTDGQTFLYYKNVFLKRITEYDKDRGAVQPNVNGLFLENDIVTRVKLNAFNVDSAMSTIPLKDGGNLTKFFLVNVSRNSPVPDPEYVNSGYTDLNVRDITLWIRTHNAGHPTHPNQQVQYFAGNYVLHRAKFYKANVTHIADLEPQLDTTNWQLLYFDATGKRSDQVGYNGVPYSVTPPHDFRLKANSFYNVLGVGLCDNEANDDTTHFDWEWCHDDSNTPDETIIHPLPVRKKLNQNIDEIKKRIGSGKWVRRSITPVDSDGTIGATAVDDFVKVN